MVGGKNVCGAWRMNPLITDRWTPRPALSLQREFQLSRLQPHSERPPSEIGKIFKMALHTHSSVSFGLFCSRSSLCCSPWLKVVQRNSFVGSRSSMSLASVTPSSCFWWVWTVTQCTRSNGVGLTRIVTPERVFAPGTPREEDMGQLELYSLLGRG